MINCIAKGFTEAGRGKPNQDSILVKRIDDSVTVIAIADGMGGKSGGDVASRIAVTTISNEVDASNFSISSIFQKVKEKIEERAIECQNIVKWGQH